ncbi:hypothetical protein BLOT_001090 [Blomia tropicalis]|nr:hypothetical protein BLOT_001090 [Blomia tropicalis]
MKLILRIFVRLCKGLDCKQLSSSSLNNYNQNNIGLYNTYTADLSGVELLVNVELLVYCVEWDCTNTQE